MGPPWCLFKGLLEVVLTSSRSGGQDQVTMHFELISSGFVFCNLCLSTWSDESRPHQPSLFHQKPTLSQTSQKPTESNINSEVSVCSLMKGKCILESTDVLQRQIKKNSPIQLVTVELVTAGRLGCVSLILFFFFSFLFFSFPGAGMAGRHHHTRFMFGSCIEPAVQAFDKLEMHELALNLSHHCYQKCPSFLDVSSLHYLTHFIN